jgi:hypothetical protein
MSSEGAHAFGSQYTRTCILRVLGLALIHIYIYIIHIYIYIYIYQSKYSPLDLAVQNKKEEVAAVLRAHGALHFLHFAAKKGMADEVAARIAAGHESEGDDGCESVRAQRYSAVSGGTVRRGGGDAEDARTRARSA